MAGESTAGIPIVVDPKHPPLLRLRRGDGVQAESSGVAGRAGAGSGSATERGAGGCTCQASRRGASAAHPGRDGMILVDEADRVDDECRPGRAEVFDISGAGDTVTAWVAMGIGAGRQRLEAARLAAVAAGVAVGKRGVAAVYPQARCLPLWRHPD